MEELSIAWQCLAGYTKFVDGLLDACSSMEIEMIRELAWQDPLEGNEAPGSNALHA